MGCFVWGFSNKAESNLQAKAPFLKKRNGAFARVMDGFMRMLVGDIQDQFRDRVGSGLRVL
jgi:hypothetical protein